MFVLLVALAGSGCSDDCDATDASCSPSILALLASAVQTQTSAGLDCSDDGATWTIRSSAADYFWSSVAYGNGLFVAVARTGTGNRVMTSACD